MDFSLTAGSFVSFTTLSTVSSDRDFDTEFLDIGDGLAVSRKK